MTPRDFEFEQMSGSTALVSLEDMGHTIEKLEWPPRFDGKGHIYRVRCSECGSAFEFRKERHINPLRVEWVQINPGSDVWIEACGIVQFQRVRQEGIIKFWS